MTIKPFGESRDVLAMWVALIKKTQAELCIIYRDLLLLVVEGEKSKINVPEHSVFCEGLLFGH